MKSDKLQAIQVMTMTATATMGVKVITFPRDIVIISGQDGWLSLILGGGLVVFFSLTIFKLLSLYPGKDLPEIMLEIGGNFIGRIMLIPIVVYTLIYPALTVRAFANGLLTFLLDKTPLIVLVLSFVTVIFLTVKKELKVIGEVIDLLFPLIIISFVAFILLIIPRLEADNIQPVLFENTGNVFRAVIPAFQALLGIGILGYVVCRVREPKNALKWHLCGFGITLTLFIVLYVVMILTFGPEELSTFVYPTITMAKAIDFPVAFFERVESLLGVIWIPVVFCSTCLYYFICFRNLVVLIKVKPSGEKYVVFAQLPLFVGIALLPKNILVNIMWMDQMENLITVVGLGFIPILTGYAVLKKRRMKKQ